ncbi:MAG: hypothetical protein IPL02_11785 [Moraxellaceae bacterium]|nr:hypothetical protein [Moraxellaceae bacterium]
MTLTLTRATWQQHLHAWQQSQLSKKDYCKKHNLKLITFYKWASKLSAKTTPTSLEQPPVSASNTALTLIPLHGTNPRLPQTTPTVPRTSIYTVPKVGALNAPFTSTMMPCPIFANS